MLDKTHPCTQAEGSSPEEQLVPAAKTFADALRYLAMYTHVPADTKLIDDCDISLLHEAPTEMTNRRSLVDDGDPAGASVDLPKTFRVIAEQCQLLAQRLAKQQQTEGKTTLRKAISQPGSEREVIAPAHADDAGRECCSETRQKLKETLEENIRIRALLKDVTGVNKRWQKYNKERQQHVNRLLATIEELQAKVQSLEQEVCILRGQSGPATSDSSLRQSYENAVKENCALQKQLEEQKENVDSLLQQLDAIRSESNERLQVLEVQVKSHKEDWAAERREKEQAIARLSEVLDELCVLRNKCREFVSDRRHVSDRRNARLFPTQATNITIQQQNHPLSPSAPELSTEIPSGTYMPYNIFPSASMTQIRVQEVRGPSRHQQNFVFVNDIEIDGASTAKPGGAEVRTSCPAITEHENAASGESSPQVDDPGSIECPGCHVVFPLDCQTNFMEHFESCQERAQTS